MRSKALALAGDLLREETGEGFVARMCAADDEETRAICDDAAALRAELRGARHAAAWLCPLATRALLGEGGGARAPKAARDAALHAAAQLGEACAPTWRPRAPPLYQAAAAAGGDGGDGGDGGNAAGVTIGDVVAATVRTMRDEAARDGGDGAEEVTTADVVLRALARS